MVFFYFRLYRAMSSPGTVPDWASLPSDAVVHILSFLGVQDRYHASLVCRAWNETFHYPQLWQRHTFWFYLPYHATAVTGVQLYGKYMKSVTLGVNQFLKENRLNACALLEQFSTLKDRRLTSLKIEFTGENPLFYSGQEFLDSLHIFFAPQTDQLAVSLRHVDLSGFSVPCDDSLIDILSDNHRDLKYLNLQNNVLVCKVSPACILRLVERCRNLEELHVFHGSMSDDILVSLAEKGRGDIKHLSIMCRREEKFGYDLSPECWGALASTAPRFRVTLGFDHTCPFNIIPGIMKPEIPVETLRLETFARCTDEINMASSYYDKTLKSLTVHTRNSVAFEEALVNLARTCPLLEMLRV